MEGKLYSWKKTSHAPSIAAQIAGEVLAGIAAKEGGVKPEYVVEVSRPKAAPLHSVFEWDNKLAGELWRREQASGLVRSLCVRYQDEPGEEPRRAYISVVPHGDDRPMYMDRLHVLSDDELLAQAEQAALAALDGWERRYRELREDSERLRPVFAGIDKAREAE